MVARTAQRLGNRPGNAVGSHHFGHCGRDHEEFLSELRMTEQVTNYAQGDSADSASCSTGTAVFLMSAGPRLPLVVLPIVGLGLPPSCR